jgi:Holliday junction DNA helicase RuvA
MIHYLKGEVVEKGTGTLVIDVNGLGLKLSVTPNVLGSCGKPGDVYRVYTHLIVREDSYELFGFADKEELSMFEKLIGVSGVGPRSAMGLLSTLRAGEIALAIITGDAKALSRAPGIGTKSAQRLVLELKGSLMEEDLAGVIAPGGAIPADGGATSVIKDAIETLIVLGYTAAEAANAVGTVKAESDRLDELVLLALKHMGK